MPSRRTVRGARSTLTALAAAALLSVAATAAAQASPGPAPDFYVPPASISGAPGSVIRSETLPAFASPPGPTGTWPGSGQRVMYVSRTENGSPTAVTGIFVDSTRPWNGRGPRPTVIVGPGTQGQGDQCAPSRAPSPGLPTDPMTLSGNEEGVDIALWTARGARVFVTDYIGLGTPGVHTYLNRVEEAHAMLDAARAADQLSHTGPSTPVALWGYSQGGGAAAAAAELQPDYAPELNLKATWAGAPLADVSAVLDHDDGTNLLGGLAGFLVNGLLARHPELRQPLDARLTPAGRAVLQHIATECISGLVVNHPFLNTDTLTTNHRSLLDNLRAIPGADHILQQQRIGTLTPVTPVLITSGINDDAVPYGQARRLALDWCARGATVTLDSDPIAPIAPGTSLNHIGPLITDGYLDNRATNFVLDRLDDTPLHGCHLD